MMVEYDMVRRDGDEGDEKNIDKNKEMAVIKPQEALDLFNRYKMFFFIAMRRSNNKLEKKI